MNSNPSPDPLPTPPPESESNSLSESNSQSGPSSPSGSSNESVSDNQSETHGQPSPEPEPEPQPTQGHQGQQPSQGQHPGQVPDHDFFRWVRSFGIQRGQDRWVGGVGSGVAQKLGIDPIIVRGLLIVLVIFAGVGLLLYGIAWALLPEPDGRIHAQDAGRGRWSTGMTGALAATALGFPALGRGFWGWGWNGGPAVIWSLLWIAAIVWLVYFLSNRRRTNSVPAQQRPIRPILHNNTDYTHTPTNVTGATAAGTSAPTLSYPTPAYPTPRYNPPHYYAPKPPRPHRPGPGRPTVLVALGGALLVGGALKAADATNILDLGANASAIAWASAAVVLGLGIVIAGARGRGAGVLSFFAIVALIVGGVFNIAPHGDRSDFGNRNFSPASVTELNRGFDLTAGKGTIDLRGLDSSAPFTASQTVDLRVTAANATVYLPENVPVQIRYGLTFGSITINGHDFDGGDPAPTEDFNSAKPGAPLIINLDTKASHVEITGGN